MPTTIKSTRPTASRLTKRQILVTIVATSCVWIILDIMVFFNSGGGVFLSSDSKLPTERRRALEEIYPYLPKILEETEERRSSNGKEIQSFGNKETEETQQMSLKSVGDVYFEIEDKHTNKRVQESEEGVTSNTPPANSKSTHRNTYTLDEDTTRLAAENELQTSVLITETNHISNVLLFQGNSKPKLESSSSYSNELSLKSIASNVLEKKFTNYFTQIGTGNKISYQSIRVGNVNKNTDQSIHASEEGKTSENVSTPVKDMDLRSLKFFRDGPGEGGKPVATFPWENAKVQEGWKRASFNEYASDKVSLERSIPDTRNSKCKSRRYDYSRLPKTAIIICFTEESWSTLLRSLHSVLNRTPPELINEILLVDDFSQTNFEGRSLQDYISKFPSVRLLRLPHRHGLVRARIAGIKNTTSEVITFLDSHIECNKGWLEPLLDTISRNRKAVVSPIIDTISSETFQYLSALDNLRGVFTWTLEFRWATVAASLPDPSDNFPTPTIAGGLFSIDRDYFYELGLYDPGLEIWGSENMELSFKTWMCGGKLEIVPCSRVGHVFRNSQPYKFPKGNVDTFLHNNIRIAEVWMDNYKKYFYAVFPKLRGVDAGDVSDRRRLKKSMKCHSFEWYLRHIYPELHAPTLTPVAGVGLRNVKYNKCLDRFLGNGPIKLSPCHHSGGSQHFQLTEFGAIETIEFCVGRIGAQLGAVVLDCKSPGVLRFKHDRTRGLLVTMDSNKCLGIAPNTVAVQLGDCDPNDGSQQWQFSEYFQPKTREATVIIPTVYGLYV